ncbi:MAG: GDSL-type esterase/lipase family protein [Elusimicrobiales bacterium]|nr:GDSL-type esterase/lipase family protein [Elusimicrobiales bacterium]
MSQNKTDKPGSFGGIAPDLLKSFAALLVLLLLLEGALRVAGRFYGGARPSVFGESEARAGAPTVLCVGDSYTYGGNVSGTEAYPHRLWLALRDNKIPARVVNGGHCEYNSSQLLDEFRGNLEKFRPRVVVLLAGSSDKWNLLGPQASDPGVVFRRNYDAQMSADVPPFHRGGAFKRALLSSRVYKMYRGIAENLRFRSLLRTAETIRAEKLAADYAAGKLEEEEMHTYLEALLYRSRYEELFELALGALKSVSPDSPLFSSDLSLYFVLSASFQYQDKYSAAETAARLESLLAARPEFAGSEPFVKYLNFFKQHSRMEARFENRLRDNIEEMANLAARYKARLVIMNYPSTHALANRLLAAAAGRHKLTFIDNHAKFEELIKAGGRDRYLMGDDHATPAGHQEMADLLLPEIKKALQ